MSSKGLIDDWNKAGSFFDLYNQGFIKKQSLVFSSDKNKKEVWQRFGQEAIDLSRQIYESSKNPQVKELSQLEVKRKVYTFYLRQVFNHEYQLVLNNLNFKNVVKIIQEQSMSSLDSWEVLKVNQENIYLKKDKREATLKLKNSYEIVKDLGFSLENSLVHLLIVGLFDDEKEDLQALSLDMQIKKYEK